MQLELLELNLYLDYATKKLDVLESEMSKLLNEWKKLLMQKRR